MNQRARNARYICKQRRRDPYMVWVHVTFPNGMTFRVRRSETWAYRADYRSRYATTFGVYPPDAHIMRELTRWS